MDGEVPFLIGRKTTEDWKMKMDFGRRVARIRVGTEEVPLEYEVDRGGHIILRLFKEKAWLGEDWKTKKEQWDSNARRLHRQFAHPSKKLKNLIKEGWEELRLRRKEKFLKG